MLFKLEDYKVNFCFLVQKNGLIFLSFYRKF